MSDKASVDLIIEPVSKDLGEFAVRRALPDKRRQRIGPVIMLLVLVVVKTVMDLKLHSIERRKFGEQQS